MMLRPSASPLPKPVAPRFHSIKVLGEGSFGKAVLVEEIATKRQCVVKQVAMGKLTAREQQETQQEALVLSTLSHPNIISYIDAYLKQTTKGSFLYIVMEFADAGDLYTLIHKRRGVYLPENTIFDLFVQMCLALKHVHDRKIVHRDVKSENIFLTSAGVLKLGDFGVSKVLKGTHQFARTKIGTPLYMAPEVMLEEKYNHKADMWSLGCILSEMARLDFPFMAKDMKGLIARIIKAQVPPLPAHYTQDLKDLVAELLSKDPADRPGANAILRRPFLRNRITSSMLSEQQMKNEFAHTMLHGYQPLSVMAPAAGGGGGGSGGSVFSLRKEGPDRLERRLPPPSASAKVPLRPIQQQQQQPAKLRLVVVDKVKPPVSPTSPPPAPVRRASKPSLPQKQPPKSKVEAKGGPPPQVSKKPCAAVLVVGVKKAEPSGGGKDKGKGPPSVSPFQHILNPSRPLMSNDGEGDETEVGGSSSRQGGGGGSVPSKAVSHFPPPSSASSKPPVSSPPAPSQSSAAAKGVVAAEKGLVKKSPKEHAVGGGGSSSDNSSNSRGDGAVVSVIQRKKKGHFLTALEAQMRGLQNQLKDLLPWKQQQHKKIADKAEQRQQQQLQQKKKANEPQQEQEEEVLEDKEDGRGTPRPSSADVVDQADNDESVGRPGEAMHPSPPQTLSPPPSHPSAVNGSKAVDQQEARRQRQAERESRKREFERFRKEQRGKSNATPTAAKIEEKKETIMAKGDEGEQSAATTTPRRASVVSSSSPPPPPKRSPTTPTAAMERGRRLSTSSSSSASAAAGATDGGAEKRPQQQPRPEVDKKSKRGSQQNPQQRREGESPADIRRAERQKQRQEMRALMAQHRQQHQQQQHVDVSTSSSSGDSDGDGGGAGEYEVEILVSPRPPPSAVREALREEVEVKASSSSIVSGTESAEVEILVSPRTPSSSSSAGEALEEDAPLEVSNPPVVDMVKKKGLRHEEEEDDDEQSMDADSLAGAEEEGGTGERQEDLELLLADEGSHVGGGGGGGPNDPSLFDELLNLAEFADDQLEQEEGHAEEEEGDERRIWSPQGKLSGVEEAILIAAEKDDEK